MLIYCTFMIKENKHLNFSSRLCETFCGGGESACFHSLVRDLLNWWKLCTQISSHVSTVFWKFEKFRSICFHLLYWILLCICSLIRWWGIILKQTWGSCKFLRRMRSINAFKMLVDTAISSYVILQFSCKTANSVNISITQNAFWAVGLRIQFCR